MAAPPAAGAVCVRRGFFRTLLLVARLLLGPRDLWGHSSIPLGRAKWSRHKQTRHWGAEQGHGNRMGRAAVAVWLGSTSCNFWKPT